MSHRTAKIIFVVVAALSIVGVVIVLFDLPARSRDLELARLLLPADAKLAKCLIERIEIGEDTARDSNSSDRGASTRALEGQRAIVFSQRFISITRSHAKKVSPRIRMSAVFHYRIQFMSGENRWVYQFLTDPWGVGVIDCDYRATKEYRVGTVRLDPTGAKEIQSMLDEVLASKTDEIAAGSEANTR